MGTLAPYLGPALSKASASPVPLPQLLVRGEWADPRSLPWAAAPGSPAAGPTLALRKSQKRHTGICRHPSPKGQEEPAGICWGHSDVSPGERGPGYSPPAPPPQPQIPALPSSVPESPGRSRQGVILSALSEPWLRHPPLLPVALHLEVAMAPAAAGLWTPVARVAACPALVSANSSLINFPSSPSEWSSGFCWEPEFSKVAS